MEMTYTFERERLPRRSKQDITLDEEKRACPICNKPIHIRYLERHCNRCFEQKFGDTGSGSLPHRESRSKSTRPSSSKKTTVKRKGPEVVSEKMNGRTSITKKTTVETVVEPDGEDGGFADDENNRVNVRSTKTRRSRSIFGKKRNNSGKVRKDVYMNEEHNFPEVPDIRSMAVPPKLRARVETFDSRIRNLPLNAIVVTNSRGNIDKKRSGQIQRAIEAEHPELPTITVRRQRLPTAETRRPLIMKVSVTEDGFHCRVPSMNELKQHSVVVDDDDDHEEEEYMKPDDDDEYIDKAERRRVSRYRPTPMQNAVATADSSIARTRPRRKDRVADIQALTLAVRDPPRRCAIPPPLLPFPAQSQKDDRPIQKIGPFGQTSRIGTKKPLVPVVFSSSSESEIEDGFKSSRTRQEQDRRPVSKSQKRSRSECLPTIRDAHDYVERMRTFHKIPSVTIATFVGLLKAYKNTQLSTNSVTRRVSSLLKDHPDLVLDFQKFLPVAMNGSSVTTTFAQIQGRSVHSGSSKRSLDRNVQHKRKSITNTHYPPTVDLSEIDDCVHLTNPTKRAREHNGSASVPVATAPKRAREHNGSASVPVATVPKPAREHNGSSSVHVARAPKRTSTAITNTDVLQKAHATFRQPAINSNFRDVTAKTNKLPLYPQHDSQQALASQNVPKSILSPSSLVTRRDMVPKFISSYPPSSVSSPPAENNTKLEITKIDGFDGVEPPGGVADIEWHSGENIDGLHEEEDDGINHAYWLDTNREDDENNSNNGFLDRGSSADYNLLSITKIVDDDDAPFLSTASESVSPVDSSSPQKFEEKKGKNESNDTAAHVGEALQNIGTLHMNVAVVRDFQRMSDISRKVQERFKDHPEIVEAFTKVVINAHAKVSPPDGPAQLSDVIATLVKVGHSYYTN